MSTEPSLGDIASIVQYEPCNYPHCDEEYNAMAETPHAPFCSEACSDRAVAWGLLKDVNKDRRFCASCYRQIRERELPGRFMGSSKVRAGVYYQQREGRQYPIRTKDPDDPAAFFRADANRKMFAKPREVPTKNTVRGAGERLSTSDPSRHNYQSAYDPTDVMCKCGAQEHDDVERPVKLKVLVTEYAPRLSDVITQRREEGEHDIEHDRNDFLDAVRERKSDPSHTSDQLVLINALAEAIDC